MLFFLLCVVMKKDELNEFWYDLVNNDNHFLWVVSPNTLTGEDGGDQPGSKILYLGC